MAKQDKSKFQLNKGTDHKFDISKGGKRKFDLTKDVDEPVASPAPAAQPKPTAPAKPAPAAQPKPAAPASPAPAAQPKPTAPAKPAPAAQPKPTAPFDPVPDPEPKSKKNFWLWIILAILVIILLIWWLLPGKITGAQPEAEEVPTEEVAAPATDSEGVSDDAEIPAGEDASGENVNNNVNIDDNSAPSAPAVNAPDATSGAPSVASNVDGGRANNGNVNNSNVTSTVSDDIEAEAMKVIRGDYGDGQERREKLGAKYQAIQSRVNELKLKGVF